MNFKDTLFSVKQTINCGGCIIDFEQPRVMGILNLTPDSFYDGGRYLQEEAILKRVEVLLTDGADILDIGGYSSRPGASEISEEEEKTRLTPALKLIRSHFPGAILSVDTFRAGIAEYVIDEFGVGLINDISAGLMDDRMFEVVGNRKVPYIMMHMKGIPRTMQVNPVYNDIVKELLAFFAERIFMAGKAGIHDIVVDPGFGFGKTAKDNYTLLHDLRLFGLLGFPIMAGLSRKSMIHKTLGITPDDALNGTTALNTIALLNGANILRVHDVKQAVETIKLVVTYLKPHN